jgi:type I restriction enzyme S subunit
LVRHSHSSSASAPSQNVAEALTPRLRFPEFRKRTPWAVVNGDKLFDPIDRRPAAPGLPVLAVTQEHGPIPRDQIDYHVSVTDASLASYKEVRPNDFIISLRSFQGGIEYSRHRGICSPAYIILSRKGDGSDDFYRHLFKSERFIRQLTRNIEGLRDGKMISFKQFSKQLLPEPQSDEQQKIADYLTSLDEVIAAHERKVETLKAHKKGLMQRVFPQEGQTLPRLRFREFRSGPAWSSRLVGDVFAEIIEKGRPEKVVLAATQELGVIPYDQMERSVIRDSRNLVGYKLVKPGQFVISLRSFEGGFEYSRYDGIISPAYVILERREPIVADFYRQLFKGAVFVSAIRRLLNNSLRDGKMISYNEAKALIIRVPELNEQQRIADFLSSLDSCVAAESASLEATKAHKKGVMQQLFPAAPAALPMPGED